MDAQKLSDKHYTLEESYYRKDENNWAIQSLWQEGQILKVITLGEEITVGDIYRNVVLEST